MGLFRKEPVLKGCPYCRDKDRHHIDDNGYRIRILPSWPYLCVGEVGSGRVALAKIKCCPFCERRLKK